MTSILEEARASINERLAELAPLVDEYHELSAVKAALDGVTANGNGHKTSHRITPRRIRGRGRPAGSGKTQTRIIEILTQQPGLGINEVASVLGIKPNYLYRAMPNLVKAGVLRQEGKSYFLAAQ
jgi:hypothetical protein